ncbi:MAG: hypothetical protein IJN37_07175 [Clostridia bacterium]|nr:hypothetical protein [Clostridia bacterium]
MLKIVKCIKGYLTSSEKIIDYSAVFVYILSLIIGLSIGTITRWIGSMNLGLYIIGYYIWAYLPAMLYIAFWLYILKHKQKNVRLIRCYTLMWAIDAVLVILMKMNTFGSINETIYKVFKIFNYPLVMEWDYYHFFLNIDNHWFNYLLVMLAMVGVCIRYLLINKKTS